MPLRQERPGQEPARRGRLAAREVLGLIRVEPKTERDEQEDAGAEQEPAFAFQAGLAEQPFEARYDMVALYQPKSSQVFTTSEVFGSADRNASSNASASTILSIGVRQARTGLAGPAVDSKLVLILARLAVAADVIADRRSPQMDGRAPGPARSSAAAGRIAAG